jgi:hypothetical protein
MKKSVETITAQIYLGLREGYTDNVHTLDELKDFLQIYVDKEKLCVTVTPTTFVYTNGREEGAIIGLINYPRFPTTRKKIKQIAEDIAKLCKKEYKQNRVSIQYQDITTMLGEN